MLHGMTDEEFKEKFEEIKEEIGEYKKQLDGWMCYARILKSW